MPLEDDWKFYQGDAPGAEQVVFDDSRWLAVNLPHDWSIAGAFAETNMTGGAGAFLPSGVAWYRRDFFLKELGQHSNDLFIVEFDGVMQNSDVWFNGHHLGHRPNGYVGFAYDLTPYLALGKTNVLAVRCDTSEQPASRWYSGAGIYRHVRLCIIPRVHLDEASPFVSTPFVSATSAVVHAQSTVTNQSSVPARLTVQFFIWPPVGNPICRTSTPPQIVAPGASLTVTQEVTVASPKLWDTEHPVLYQAVTRILYGQEVHQVQTASFGLRDAHFEADTGFWLNGKNFKLNGVCLHHDGGAFGAAVPLAIWEQRLKTLKTLGVNAIRTAHNPPAPEFLDLCDRLGFLVMDEFFDCWTVAKNPYDYHLYFDTWAHTDERDTIRRDRNHPSVIIYSVGNEIHDTPQVEKAKRILKGLVEVAHATDPTRPVTQALFRPNVSHDYEDGLADLLDVVGQNYREKEILAAHEQKPTRKILGTENTHDRNQWLAVRDNAPYAGQFLWTGVDYLGESKRWPLVAHASGLLDRTGEIKPRAYERASWWQIGPMVRIMRRTAPDDRMPGDPGYGGEELHTQVEFADWTPRNPAPHDETVEAYSNGEEVELFLNGKSLGAKTINADASPRIWRIAFAAGTLKAVAKSGGQVVATDELRTADKPAKIVLTTETKELSPGFDNVAVIRAIITDENGIRIPRAADRITFKISGPAVIAAVDNGDNTSHELFQTNSRSAFQGECVAFVKATAAGAISISATAPGLAGGAIEFPAATKLK